MVKVLIVEDMDITREDIIGLIQWEQHGFELLPSARNGKIGLEYALRYQPDIILTDIKMPVMTGLDMIEEIIKREQDVKFILLTAYEEFELAKRALEMGAQAFILKYEIDRKMLLRELNKCVEAIRKEQDIKNITVRAHLGKLLAEGDGGIYTSETSSSEIVSRRTYFQWIGTSILLDIWRLKMRNDIGEENLQDMLTEKMGSYRFICLKISEREYIIFLKSPDSNSQMEQQRYLRDFVLSVQDIFRELLNTQIAVAVGGKVSNNRDILAARREGADILQYRIFRKGSCLLEKKPDECTSELKDKILTEVEFIGRDIREEKYTDAKKKIEELYSKDIADSQSIETLKKATVKLSYYFREKGYEVKLFEFDEWLERVQINLLQESIYNTAERFGYLLEILRECTEKQYSRKVREAMAYMRAHYHEDVGLNEAAVILDVSPIYLSHLFKKETGITFSGYVTSLRIERAKELLRQGDKKIYEISDLVGYQTVQYFSKVFKKETGKNPKEFE